MFSWSCCFKNSVRDKRMQQFSLWVTGTSWVTSGVINQSWNGSSWILFSCYCVISMLVLWPVFVDWSWSGQDKVNMPPRQRPLESDVESKTTRVLKHWRILSVGAATTLLQQRDEKSMQEEPSRTTKWDGASEHGLRCRGARLCEETGYCFSTSLRGYWVFSPSSVPLFSNASQRVFEPAESKTAAEHFNKRDAGLAFKFVFSL